MSLGSGRAPETDRDDEGLCDDFSGWGIEPNEGEADDRPPRARYDGRGEAEERSEQVVEVTTRKDEAGEGDNMRRFQGVWALSPPKSDFRSQTPGTYMNRSKLPCRFPAFVSTVCVVRSRAPRPIRAAGSALLHLVWYGP